MPRRYRLDDDDDRPVRRKKKSNTALIVGLSVGGGVLVIAVITIIAVASGRKSRSGDDSIGPIARPVGKKTVGDLEEVVDPTVVDRIWPRLTGTWKPVDGNASFHTYEFYKEYQYRKEWNNEGKLEIEFNPVLTIRDDSRTTSAKTGECYSLFYHVKNPDGSGRLGNVLINVYPDGTLEIDTERFRRVN